jgi:hypothetical protein
LPDTMMLTLLINSMEQAASFWAQILNKSHL